MRSFMDKQANKRGTLQYLFLTVLYGLHLSLLSIEA